MHFAFVGENRKGRLGLASSGGEIGLSRGYRMVGVSKWVLVWGWARHHVSVQD